jgi:hypothetical protein
MFVLTEHKRRKAVGVSESLQPVVDLRGRYESVRDQATFQGYPTAAIGELHSQLLGAALLPFVR